MIRKSVKPVRNGAVWEGTSSGKDGDVPPKRFGNGFVRSDEHPCDDYQDQDGHNRDRDDALGIDPV